MSWSVSLIGTPSGVSKQLDVFGETLTGQSKDEFMDAKPHLQALLAQNVQQNVRIDASGHAYFDQGQKKSGNCTVKIESFYGQWCE